MDFDTGLIRKHAFNDVVNTIVNASKTGRSKDPTIRGIIQMDLDTAIEPAITKIREIAEYQRQMIRYEMEIFSLQLEINFLKQEKEIERRFVRLEAETKQRLEDIGRELQNRNAERIANIDRAIGALEAEQLKSPFTKAVSALTNEELPETGLDTEQERDISERLETALESMITIVHQAHKTHAAHISRLADVNSQDVFPDDRIDELTGRALSVIDTARAEITGKKKPDPPEGGWNVFDHPIFKR